MSIYKRLGVRKIINAAGTLTIYGGSTMPSEVTSAMIQSSHESVVFDELLTAVNKEIAEITNNEAALVTNSASAGLAISTAACITGSDLYKIDRLPFLDGLKNEVIIHRSQRNKHDHAIRQVGVNIIEIGNVRETHSWQLESEITDKTACIFYFAASNLSRGTLPLEEVIKIGKRKNVPVIVDAAAQIPPVDNLWLYTQMGADLVVFSGGKALRGPQSSGLILGRKNLIDACKLNSSPNSAIGRAMKIGKEEVIGLLVAIERYINLDHKAQIGEYEQYINYLKKELDHPGIFVERLNTGPSGQTHPRALISVKSNKWSAYRIKQALENSEYRIMVTLSENRNGIIINPLNIDREEGEIIVRELKSILKI